MLFIPNVCVLCCETSDIEKQRNVRIDVSSNTEFISVSLSYKTKKHIVLFTLTLNTN